ncbi:hypothetical protein FB451DRAFT_1448731 [Mycena latifolia]|nr:hypothetical protein FB451DRAFT_1448731 [Mycena latifolia]
MGAKYLCCLPLRLGVLVISFLQFLVSAFTAVILGAALVLDAHDKDGSPRIPLGTKIITIITMVGHIFVALICLVGFIGGIRKKESYVGAFSILLRYSLIVHVTTAVANLILYVVDRNDFRDKCIGDSTDQKVIDACDKATKLPLWAVIVSMTIPILFQAYGVYIVSAYEKSLYKEEALHKMHLRRESFSRGPVYVPVGEEARPLTNAPQLDYPYADKSHSFGAPV